MKTEVLNALMEKWARCAIVPDAEDGSEATEIPNAIEKGLREGYRRCINDLRQLIRLLD